MTRRRCDRGRARRRPGRPDRGAAAGPPRRAGDRARGRRPGGRPRKHRRARRLPLRPRRPPLLHQERRGERPLARGARRRVPRCARACRASTGAARFLDYPLRAARRAAQARPGRADARRWPPTRGAAPARRGGEETFEDWVANRFGRRLFELFFRSTPRRCGACPPRRSAPSGRRSASASLSFATAVRSGAARRRRRAACTSLIEEFHYPRLGPGQMWEAWPPRSSARAARCGCGTPVERIRPRRPARVAVVDGGGERLEVPRAVISSLPLRALAALAGPARRPRCAPPRAGLRYRDFLTVALVLDGDGPLPRHLDLRPRPGGARGAHPELPRLEPGDGAGRGARVRGARVLLLRGRRLWRRSRRRSSSTLAPASSSASAWPPRAAVEGGYVVRVPKAYPIYDADYAERVDVIRAWLGRARQPPAGRAQRAAPVQQLRPLDAHRACARSRT